jgi:phosphatidylglycerophosphate synthase
MIQLRLLANMLDGMVALEQGTASPLGALFNEVPDRISDAATLIGAGYAAGGCPVLGYVAACLAVFLAYLRVQGKVVGAPQEFCGPMAKPQRMFTLTVAAVYAGLAPRNWQPAFAVVPGASTLAVALALVLVGEVMTAGRRLRRIARALRKPA